MTAEIALKTAIEKAFTKIGSSNGTKLQDGGDNLDPLLHEGFVAQHLAHIAGKRWDAFKKRLDDEGLLDGVATSNYALVVKTNNPTEVIDQAMFEQHLISLGVSADVLRTARQRATKQRKGATRITIGVL